MPFSLKRFALPRSTSMPGKHQQQHCQQGHGQQGHHHKSSSGGKMPVSRSAEMMQPLKEPDVIQTERHLPPPLGVCSTLPPRWRPQPPPTQQRPAVPKKNGVRFQGGAPPDLQPTTYNKGGKSGGPGHGAMRLNQWGEDDPKLSTQSLKRPPSRRHPNSSLPRPSMDLESRLYQPPSSIYEDDPGIMSEAETSATGFRRSSKIRSSLPIVRTPSKTQERPLGMVFLQYLSETKRALLPNEITSMDTVKALFVRSFSKQLSMAYMDSGHVHIYIHDPAKDMFYELEDLRDVKDRSVLRIYEQDHNGVYSTYDQDTSYFSEPEFDSDYHHQHIHKTKQGKPPATTAVQSAYYGTVLPPYNIRSQTLPHPRTAYAPGKPSTASIPSTQQAPPKPQRSFQQTTLPPTGGKIRPPGPGGGGPPALPPGHPSDRRHEPQGAYRPLPERPYSALGQHPDAYRVHEAGYASSPEHRGPSDRNYYVSSYDDSCYGLYGARSESGTPVIDEEARVRMECMERQLASLTGLVQKALTIPRHVPSSRTDVNNKAESPKESKNHNLYEDRSRQSTVGGGAFKPTTQPEFRLSPELYFHMRQLRKQTKDIRQEIRNLRRFAQSQTIATREAMRETSSKIKSLLATAHLADDQSGTVRTRVNREEELYKQDVAHLEKDLSELESQVEELRSNVINRRCRVNMNDVETMALVLSRASKVVADLKGRFPTLQDTLKSVMTSEMEVVIKEEKFLKDEPEKLETALKRCKKLTGTLVTLRRLASVQEQRSSHITPPPTNESKATDNNTTDLPATVPAAKTVDSSPHTVIHVPPDGHQRPSRAENALDALLDELQTFNKPAPVKRDVIPGLLGPQKRLPSYPSGDSPTHSAFLLVGGGKPAESANTGGEVKKTPPPPPPPRTTSRSPVSSPTGSGPNFQFGATRGTESGNSSTGKTGKADGDRLSSNSSSSESVNSQEGLQPGGVARQEMLEHRHQELLRKQKQLQEQYARLQQLQRFAPLGDLKKTGSESNILAKSALAPAQAGSLTHLAGQAKPPTTTKIFETDIL